VRVASHHPGDRVLEGYYEAIRERLSPMYYNEPRPSYLLLGLIEQGELRELLEELYFHGLVAN
jgi:hypothetical protein